MASINDVLDSYEKKAVKINIRQLDEELILIEGNQESLTFLGDLFLAVARSGHGNIHLSPSGAGSLFFNKKSELGIYINKK